MTVAEIERSVQHIQMVAGDDERAHSMQDALVERVLRDIAEGSGEAKSLASAALRVFDIEFVRWCA